NKKGLGSGLEYRFKLKEDSWGKLYSYYANEENNYFRDEYRDRKDRDKDRGYLNFEGEHYFNQDFYVKGIGSYISDREFYGDYNDEVKRSKADVSRGKIKSLEKDESLMFLNKNWDFYNLLVNVDYYKNLTNSDHATLQRMPQVVFSSMRLPLANTPFFYQLDSSYDYFWRNEGQKGHRVEIFPKISLPVNYGGWLKFNPEIGIEGLSYAHVKDDRGYDTTGLFPSMKAELSANFIRVFSFEGKLLQKLKHTIEPGLLYEYVADSDQDEFPGFDIPEGFFRRHSLGYYIKNRFSGLITDANGEAEEQEIGYFLLGQSYNIRQPIGGIYLQGDPDKDFSDVFSELRVGILPKLYALSKVSYSTSDNRLRYNKAFVNLGNDKGDHIRIGYIYERERFKGYSVKGRCQIYGPTFAFFDARYNSNRNDKLDTELGIDYSAQCWGSRISIETTGSSAGRKSDTSFYYKFYLKGLGRKL
ncbi:MAG: LPS assembly protein LptD, partial [Pseudomonadota bacterium]